MTVHAKMYDGKPVQTEQRWRRDGLFSSKDQTWRTPLPLFRMFDEVFDFDLDAAATDESALCERFLTEREDALSLDEWPGDRVWLNPPYGRQVGSFVCKAKEQAREHGKTVAVLIFARTDTVWWHEHAMSADEIFLIRGRLRFSKGEEKAGSAPAPSAVLIFRGRSVAQAAPRVQSLRVPRDNSDPS